MKDTYPQYYEVDTTLIIIKKEGDEVAGYTTSGAPYPPYKTIVEGGRITEEEYNQKLAQQQLNHKPAQEQLNQKLASV